MKLIVLVMSLLLFVGCGSKTPYVKVDVTLNQNVELKLMRQAVIDAAAKESWDIDRKLLQ